MVAKLQLCLLPTAPVLPAHLVFWRLKLLQTILKAIADTWRSTGVAHGRLVLVWK
jgi:hypothetical protein